MIYRGMDHRLSKDPRLPNNLTSPIYMKNPQPIIKRALDIRRLLEYGCTLLEDVSPRAPSTPFKKGMQGHILEAKQNRKAARMVLIYIEGITGFKKDGNWIDSQWAPAELCQQRQIMEPELRRAAFFL